jgi:3D-(3,5/4)-trihydroxycyclohexane-1,2-dione acylhydrolase (decyclizing)
VIETIAGRANLLNGHPLNIGPVGVTGSDSANAVCGKGRCHHRGRHKAAGFHHRVVDGIRQGGEAWCPSMPRAMTRGKHLSLPVVGDAKLGIEALDASARRLHDTGGLDRFRAS